MEVVYFEGAIVGLAQRIPCRVSAFRITTGENWTDSEHAIVEDAKTDTLPDCLASAETGESVLPLR
jgi:hypothetical protein